MHGSIIIPSTCVTSVTALCRNQITTVSVALEVNPMHWKSRDELRPHHALAFRQYVRRRTVSRVKSASLGTAKQYESMLSYEDTHLFV